VGSKRRGRRLGPQTAWSAQPQALLVLGRSHCWIKVRTGVRRVTVYRDGRRVRPVGDAADDHVERARELRRGPGRVGIHGRAGLSLQDPLGSARSHGCVRADNHQIAWMAAHVPAGTPVRIRL
jgi:hypothetical protein